MPKVSVIVPIYKVEEYLPKCVDSILSQTFTDFECILVDDGSPDNCGKICDEYAKKDSRIKVIHKENGGLSSARNAGLDIAQGEYITFVDSDDWINVHMLQVLYDAIIEKDADVSLCRHVIATNKDCEYRQRESIQKKVVCEPSKEGIDKVIDKFQISACARLYKDTIFRSIRFREGLLWEDFHIRPYILYLCEKFVQIDVALYYILRRENSITGSDYTFKKVASFQKIYKDHLKLYKTKHDEEMYAQTVRMKCYSLIFDDLHIRRERRDLWKAWKPYHKRIKIFLLQELFHKRICARKKLILFLLLTCPKRAYEQVVKYFPEMIENGL